MNIDEFIGRKTQEVAKEVLSSPNSSYIVEKTKKTILPNKEPTFFGTLKEYENIIKEGCEFAGVDYKIYKKRIIDDIKQVAKEKLQIPKPTNSENTNQNYNSDLIPKKSQVHLKSNETLDLPIKTNTKMDLNKIFAGVDLLIKFSKREDVKVKELQIFMEAEKETIKKLVEPKYLGGLKLFFRMAGEEKTILELKQFIEEEKETIEELFN